MIYNKFHSFVFNYADNLGHIEVLCISLIEPNNCLSKVDGYIPVPQARITVRC